MIDEIKTKPLYGTVMVQCPRTTANDGKQMVILVHWRWLAVGGIVLDRLIVYIRIFYKFTVPEPLNMLLLPIWARKTWSASVLMSFVFCIKNICILYNFFFFSHAIYYLSCYFSQSPFPDVAQDPVPLTRTRPLATLATCILPHFHPLWLASNSLGFWPSYTPSRQNWHLWNISIFRLWHSKGQTILVPDPSLSAIRSIA